MYTNHYFCIVKNIISVLFISIFLAPCAPYRSNAGTKRISVLTCTPGEELYSLFGHSALRVKDSMTGSDIIYNWGTFDFNEPGFYLKFMRGKLLYYVSAWTLPEFLYEYQTQQRFVYEQVLHLDSTDESRVLAALDTNLLPKNIYYKYDFLLDNCTTRIRDIILKNLKQKTNLSGVYHHNSSYRDLIHFYLDRGNQPWSKLGIDIVLGSHLDKTADINGSFFLPEFFMKGLSDLKTDKVSLVADNKILVSGKNFQDAKASYFPVAILSFFSIVCWWLINKNDRKYRLAVDGLIFLLTGILGILLLFMWLGTDHTVCQRNLNVAWAMPTNLIVGFMLSRKNKWLHLYFGCMALITSILLAGWFWWHQELNLAVSPIVLLLLNRYLYYFKNTKAQ